MTPKHRVARAEPRDDRVVRGEARQHGRVAVDREEPVEPQGVERAGRLDARRIGQERGEPRRGRQDAAGARPHAGQVGDRGQRQENVAQRPRVDDQDRAAGSGHGPVLTGGRASGSKAWMPSQPAHQPSDGAAEHVGEEVGIEQHPRGAR